MAGQYNVQGQQVAAGAQTQVAQTAKETQLGVAETTGKYDVQGKALEAGAQTQVAETTGKYAVQGAETTGKYGVEQTRMAGQYNVAQTAEAGAQQRLTQQQQLDYDKYKSQRDYQWSRQAYKA